MRRMQVRTFLVTIAPVRAADIFGYFAKEQMLDA